MPTLIALKILILMGSRLGKGRRVAMQKDSITWRAKVVMVNVRLTAVYTLWLTPACRIITNVVRGKHKHPGLDGQSSTLKP